VVEPSSRPTGCTPLTLFSIRKSDTFPT
jgi:hypothetical protein